MSGADEGILKRLDALEAGQKEIVSQLDGLQEIVEGHKKVLPKAPAKPVEFAHPLHPGKRGTVEYEQLRTKLLAVKPHEKGHAEAQATLREAGLVS